MASLTYRYLASVIALALAGAALGDDHPGNVPVLNSRPGAAYTVYLDFAGFNYTGQWGGDTVGNVPAFYGVTTSFNAGQISSIKDTWARVAEKYAALNVNVTTVDPAVAAGKSSTDFQRQAFYDSTAKLMHTVIGGTSAWAGGNYGGYSFIGTTQNAYDPSAYNGGAGWGAHTNWIYSAGYESQKTFLGEAAAHENGHGFGLDHQSDFVGSNLINEYSLNGTSTYGSASYAHGNGSYAPTMGDSYYSQRGTWRVGASDGENGKQTQNDVSVLLSNADMKLQDDGIGHSLASATSLSLLGKDIDPSKAKGYISPVTDATHGPVPMGVDSYTKDFFSFHSNGGSLSLTVHDGAELLASGSADPGATLESKLVILDKFGNIIGQGIESGDTLSETYSGVLGAGDYYASILSMGGYFVSPNDISSDSASYYTMGSYFLSGSGFEAVPEPASMLVFGLGFVAFFRKRRK